MVPHLAMASLHRLLLYGEQHKHKDDKMIFIFNTPKGIVQVNSATITDTELAELGLTRKWADEQLHQEALAAEFNDKMHKALLAYNNWDSLTLPQKDTVLKNIVGYLLYQAGLL